MKPDPLRIELLKFGGGFGDGIYGSFIFEEWAVIIAHREHPQEFVLAVGERNDAITAAITRFKTIITHLESQLT